MQGARRSAQGAYESGSAYESGRVTWRHNCQPSLVFVSMNNTSRSAAAVIVIAPLLISLVHGMAHEAAKIYPPAAGNAFAYTAIPAGPLVALGLMWTQCGFGAELLAATMAGSLVFGVVMYFVIAGPDHVGHIASDT